MINVLIAPQATDVTINVRFADSVSTDELKAAWEDVSDGTLQHHIRDAIWFECVRRGFEPRDVIPDP
jgi:hypothetical protein